MATPTTPKPPKTYYDFLGSAEGGMQSGVSPLLLGKNQVGFALNTSVRGGFLKPRPPIQKKTLNFNNDAVLQKLVQKGFFQGGGYYRPDFGTESLLAQISGHLIKFTETSVGGDWTVTDISVPGDLNDPSANQVWMNQAEKWEIITDGSTKLPIFYDGTTSRRSFGPSQVLGTTVLPFTVPAFGATVQLTLTAPYTGQYNVPVFINGAFYQPIPNVTPSSYAATLTNISDTPASVIGVQSQVSVIPQNVGWTNNVVIAGVSPDGSNISFNLAFDPNLPPIPPNQPVLFKIGGYNYSCLTANLGGGVYRVFTRFNFQVTYFPIPTVQLIVFTSVTAPTVSLGTVQAVFTVPAVDGQVTVQLSQPYTGPVNQPVWINGQQYLISPVTLPPPANILTAINLTDTPAAVVNPPIDIYSVPELPAGRMGAYGLGRQWLCLTDGLSFIAGDIVGGSAGTQANNYRDSVLKVTENTYLTGGGAFRVPGSVAPLTNGAFGLPNSGDIITAMIFAPTLDASLGQGALEVFTSVNCFSCNAPVIRSDWQTLTNPILTEALKDKGAVAQNSTVSVNSDTFFRTYDGLASLIQARRDFEVWGNKSISNELQRVLNRDNQNLLPYGSGMTFDNRYFTTAAPNALTQGVFHVGLATLNLDLLSSLRDSQPPAWESIWTGINALQIISGRVNGSKRAFAWTVNLNTLTIELYEFLPETTTVFQDNGTNPILWLFETPVLFNKDIKSITDLVQLEDGEVYLSDIQGNVEVKVFYRPDFYSCWTLWRDFTVCASATTQSPGYRMRVGLGSPDVTPCEPSNNRPLRNGYFFQCRVEITGACVWRGMRASATSVPQPEFAKIECTPIVCQDIPCAPPDDLRVYSLQGLPPANLPPVPPPPPAYFNETVYFLNLCPSGNPTFTGALPNWITLDAANNRFVGNPGVISGNTQAEANATAQLVLNQFVQTNFANSNISCASCGFDPALAAHTFGISGYADGMLTAPLGTGFGDPVWDGNFSVYQVGPVFTNEWNSVFPVTISGVRCVINQVVLGFAGCVMNTPTWQITIQDEPGNLFGLWNKTGGNSPAGLYTYTPGSGPGPQPDLTIVQTS